MLRSTLAMLFACLLMVSKAQINEPITIVPYKTLPPLQESVINIPVKIYARPYMLQADSITPKEFLSDGWPDYIQSGCDFRYKYRFLRSGLSFACLNNKMTITFSGTYQIAGSRTVCAFGKQMSPWVNGSCGFGDEPMRKVQISINSLLAFQPDYTLRTTTLPEKITPIDKCTVTIFNSDVTQEVVDSIGAAVAAFGISMDKKVAGLSFSSILQTLAEKTGRKIAIKNYGYIKLNPSFIKAGRINIVNDTMNCILGISCYPEISSDSINTSVTHFLPPLQSAELSPGFIINTNAIYDYQSLDTLLNQSFSNYTSVLEGKTMILKSIAVRGLENNRVEIQVDFDGDKRGTIYFTGTPLLDVEKQVITIPDLDYSLRTRDLFLNVGKTLFNKRIVSMLRQKGTLNISELYQKNKLLIDSGLNRAVNLRIYLAGETSNFRVTGLVIKKDNLLLQTSIKGNLAIRAF